MVKGKNWKRNAVAFIAMVVTVMVTACSDIEVTGSEIYDITQTQESNMLSDYYVEPLPSDAVSNVRDGAVKYGAVIDLGDLDELGRATYAHIRLKDGQEPGENGEERNEYINIDPPGWRNFKEDGHWVNNRCHLVGYQFSGLNDEPRNLATGTAYVNKGAADGMDEDNPESMLYYEQRLDDWLGEHPDSVLDLYVQPVYGADGIIAEAFYMQWVGFDGSGSAIPIELGGLSGSVSEPVNGVLLLNQADRNGTTYWD